MQTKTPFTWTNFDLDKYIPNGSGLNPDCIRMDPSAVIAVVEKMAFGSVEITATLLLFFLRRAQLRRARRRTAAQRRMILLAFGLIDRERLLDAAAIRSCHVVNEATVERHSWARTRIASFFPDIIENWSDGIQA